VVCISYCDYKKSILPNDIPTGSDCLAERFRCDLSRWGISRAMRHVKLIPSYNEEEYVRWEDEKRYRVRDTPNEFDVEVIFDSQFRLGWVFLVQGKRESAGDVRAMVKLTCNAAVEVA
jgi:hypothetical protein